MSGARSASPASSRAEAAEKRSTPDLSAACVSGLNVSLSFFDDLAEVHERRVEVGLVGLDEAIDPLGGRGHVLARGLPGVEELVEVLGALGHLGDAGRRQRRSTSRVLPAFSNATVAAASALEGSGDTAPSMIGAAAGLVAVFRSPGPSPGRMSIATSPISDRESRGTDPALSLYFRSSERVTSTPSGWPGRSSKAIAATSPMRMPLLRTGIPSLTPGASA